MEAAVFTAACLYLDLTVKTMAKDNRIDVLQIVCFAVGVGIGIIVMRVLFGFGPIVGGALGGGLGAAFGMGVYALIKKSKDE